MKKTIIAAVLFLGFTTAIFAQAQGRCMKCKEQVEIQNGGEIVLGGEVIAKVETSASEFVYILRSTHGHAVLSLPTTAVIAIGEHTALKVEVRGWNPETKEPVSAQVYERLKRELEIDVERRSGGF